MDNFFTFKDDEYVRELNPVADYIEIQTFYLAKMSGKPVAEVKQYVIDQIKPGGQFELRDPKVAYLSREDSRDRVKASTTILEYIASARNRNYIFVPAWNVYVPSYINTSLYTGYIDATSAVRSKYKKAMFIAEQKNIDADIKFNDGMQSSAKISINSISGAALSANTINHTQSLHNTLTGICAASTSLANLNNEKFIAGNRIYITYQATLDSIITILLKTNIAVLNEVISSYAIHIPTVDETMRCIVKSTDLYWRDSDAIGRLHAFVSKLDGVERAAIVYIGDMYHLDVYNPRLVEDFLIGFTRRTREVLPFKEAVAVDDVVDSDVSVLAKLLCKEYLMGTTLRDLKNDNPDQYGEVCANMVVINNHLLKYRALIESIFRPAFLNSGGNRYAVPNMLREGVLTSDTDSTIYTAQYWVKRITGSIGFDDEHYNVGFTLSFLVNKTVYHQLAMMSKNMGFEDKHLHTISMKNEYYFPVYALTNQTKNYFAYISVREGNVYTKMKLEKKGVGLRSSKIPRNVMNQFDDYLKMLMDKIITEQNITIDELFGSPYRVENEIRDSILKGKSTYFQTSTIKSPESYKQGQSAPALKLHRFWDQVFAPTYGATPELPYTGVKVSTTLTSMKRINEWLNSLDNVELAERARQYFINENRKDIGMIYVPQLAIGQGDIPPEIVSIIDVDRQLMNVMGPFYLTLESFGFYLRNPRNTTMIYSAYVPKE